MTATGWGSLPWGGGPWGAGGTPLELLDALAVKENVVHLTFSTAPYLSKQLDPHDASNPERFQIVNLAEPVGLDGHVARPVRPVLVERAKVKGSLGAVLAVTTDRPMSPVPSQYRVVVNQLIAEDGGLLVPGKTAREFPGLYRQLRPQSPSSPTPSRDIANPQTYSAQLDPIPQAGDPHFLGVIPIDASGDYAFDQGISQLKKRIFRRLLTNPGSFPAIPNYGVGVLRYGKKLGAEAIRQQIVQDAEAQIAQEPDVAAVKVTAFSDPTAPSVTIFRIRVRPSGSQGTTQFDIPFSPV